MPVHYVIDNRQRLVITTAKGVITFREIIDQQDQILKDPAFEPTFNQLVDATGATSVDLSVTEIKEIAHRRIFSDGSRRAFVSTDVYISAIGRLMEICHEAFHDVECQIFGDRHEALEWLGIPKDSGLFNSLAY